MRAICLILACLCFAAAPLPAHEHKPPHHGSLQVFGKELAHLELLLDAKTGKLTAYALDGEAEHSVRLVQASIKIRVLRSIPQRPPFTVVLHAVANPLTGETVGDSSQFEGDNGRLAGLTAFEGQCEKVTLRGLKFPSTRIKYPEGNE
jgi:hypothetical protein